jgi:hypothetical protein
VCALGVVTRRLLLAGRQLLTGRRLFAPTARWHSPAAPDVPPLDPDGWC